MGLEKLVYFKLQVTNCKIVLKCTERPTKKVLANTSVTNFVLHALSKHISF